MCHTGEDNQYFTHSHGCDDGASNKALQIMSRLHLATQQRWNTNEPLQGKSRKRRASSSSSGGGVGMTASGVAINNHAAGSSGSGSRGGRRRGGGSGKMKSSSSSCDTGGNGESGGDLDNHDFELSSHL